MKRNTALLTLTSAAAAALLLAGCTSAGGSAGGDPTAGGGDAASDLTIAGIGNNASDPFYQTLMCGATTAAAELGVSLEWAAPNMQSVPEQQTNLDAALLNDPDGVLITPADPAAFSTQVEDLMADGIPVVTPNLGVEPDTALATVVSSDDNTEFIDFIVNDIGETGTLGILGGVAAAGEALQVRWRPLVEQLAEQAPGITVLETEYSDFDRSKATTIAAAMITANPDLKAIYAISGPEGEGVAAAVEEAGKTGEIKVYAYDSAPGEVEALRAGTITAARPARRTARLGRPQKARRISGGKPGRRARHRARGAHGRRPEGSDGRQHRGRRLRALPVAIGCDA
jgi:ABC-type sugar transport system substrate-binding protein